MQKSFVQNCTYLCEIFFIDKRIALSVAVKTFRQHDCESHGLNRLEV